MSTSKPKKIKAKDFDAAFDAGEDVLDYLDLESVKVRYPTQRLSIDFPTQVITSLDQESAKIGVTRTSLIKMWISDRLRSL